MALFAALSYIATHSQRASNPEINEKDKLAAARILNFCTSVKVGYERLLIKTGDSTKIAFNNDVYKNINGNFPLPVGSPATFSNHLFHPEGGGVIPLTFEDLSVPCPACTPTSTMSGHVSFHWSNAFPDEGTSASDPGFSVYNISKQLCLALNETQGVEGIPADVVLAASSNMTLVSPALAAISGTEVYKIRNKQAYCTLSTSTPRYISGRC